MATLRLTPMAASGANLGTRLRFERLTRASQGDTDQEVFSPGVVMAVMASATPPSTVTVVAGEYLVTWPSGPRIARMTITVPAGDGTYDIWNLRSADGADPQAVIYWGTSGDETLDEAGLLALSGSVTKSRASGTYVFGAGGYKYFAWPDGYGSPAAGTGFKDADNGWPISMAAAAEGYSQSQNGWGFLLLTVSGRSYRLYRTRQKLGGALSIIVS